MHRFRPKFLRASNGLPSYYSPYEFEHTCLLNCQPNGDGNVLTGDDEHPELTQETMECLSVPFVASTEFQKNDVAKKFANIIKEVHLPM